MKKHVKVLVLEDTESIGDILPVDLQKKITRETVRGGVAVKFIN